MRVLLQRVNNAAVSIGGSTHSEIRRGMLVFLGITHKDTSNEARNLAQRCASLRIYEDDQGKMNLSLKDIAGEALVVSQFTLYADTRKGNRPSFLDAAPPEEAELLYNEFVEAFRSELGPSQVQTGVFRAMMEVGLVNEGPVTILLESKNQS